MQHPKDEIRERVLIAARRLFAQHGYQHATMAQIATESGVATGNLYHYFANKERLLAAVVPDTFVRTLFDVLAKKVHALDGVDDIRVLPPGAEYHRISAELLDFCIIHRQRMIILATGVAGSALQDVPDRIVAALVSLALDHFRSVSPGLSPTRIQRVAVDLTYRNFIQAASAILATFKRDTDARKALDALIRYHVTGLRTLFQPRTD